MYKVTLTSIHASNIRALALNDAGTLLAIEVIDPAGVQDWQIDNLIDGSMVDLGNLRIPSDSTMVFVADHLTPTGKSLPDPLARPFDLPITHAVVLAETPAGAIAGVRQTLVDFQVFTALPVVIDPVMANRFADADPLTRGLWQGILLTRALN